MKFAIQYVSDPNGNPQAVQLSIDEWKRLLVKLQKYEQTLKVKSDLHEAFEQVAALRKSRAKKQTLEVVRITRTQNSLWLNNNNISFHRYRGFGN